MRALEEGAATVDCIPSTLEGPKRGLQRDFFAEFSWRGRLVDN